MSAALNDNNIISVGDESSNEGSVDKEMNIDSYIVCQVRSVCITLCVTKIPCTNVGFDRTSHLFWQI
jgi:hypothetical protein